MQSIFANWYAEVLACPESARICGSRGVFVGRRFLAFAFLHGLAEEEFDLGVDAAEFLRGPGFQLGPESGVDAEEEGLAFGHG